MQQGYQSNRPQPWKNLRRVPTMWVEYGTSKAVLDNGQVIQPRIGGRRKNPNLTDLLETALANQVQRIMLSGKVPLAERGQRHWLLVQTPGWSGAGHWLSAPVTGRFVHDNSNHKVEVRTTAEWFGNTPLNPMQARGAWLTLEKIIGEAFDGMPIAMSPAGTGTNLWAASLPKNVDPYPVTDDIAEEIHRTSGQHHLEHLVAGPARTTHPSCVPLVDPEQTPKLERFAYIDGRFMYASLCRELGIGPGIRLNQRDTFDMMNEDPYARARVYIRFTVPDTWNHVGIFGVQHPNPRDGWYYPNRPGAKGECWADTAEIHVAQQHGWHIEFMESVKFTSKIPGRDKNKLVATRPVDTFAERIKRARDWIENDPYMDTLIRSAVAAGLRAILIQTIGAFASRGRTKTLVTEDAKTIPSEFQDNVQKQGNLLVYKAPSQMNQRTGQFYHPELAAQIWARGRAKVLRTPMANGITAGALSVDPRTLLGINGDAIYLSDLPQWSLPVENGGADDGKAGRLRLQGFIDAPVKTPVTLAERDKLRAKSVREGIDAAINYGEFTQPDDDADYLADLEG